jgi:hypothetical protein
MKTLRWLPLLAVALFGTACDLGEIFGPPTAVVSVQVSREGMAGDVLTIYINSEAQDSTLTDFVPTRLYRPEVQTERHRGYRLRDDGMIYVAAWSENLGVLSRTKHRRAYTDRITPFEFRRSDFRLLSFANTKSSTVVVTIEGVSEKSVELAPGETKEVWVDWVDDEYEFRIRDLRTGEERRDTLRFGEDESRLALEVLPSGSLRILRFQEEVR